MVLVVGGSGSGKSAYAEELAVSLAQESVREREMKKYYVATMRVMDEEGQKKADRHRNLRKDKGFLTIEQPTGILGALEKMEPGDRTVLLECISNLTANEMFSEKNAKTDRQVTEDLVSAVKRCKEQITHFVVVSSNVFEDGITYHETTMAYLYAMGRINRKLATMADRVVEVTAGIPINIK